MPAARLLDLTRLVSRLGRGPMTGIDRVEAQWLNHLVTGAKPAFALIRSAAGFLLLDRAGMARLLDSALPARGDILSRLGHRRDPLRARAETLARRLSLARCLPGGLARMLRRHLPQGGVYLNVGHSNLSDRSLAAIRAAGMRVMVMIHDTIPLDHPHLARADTVEPFRRKLAAVATHADRVLHLTEDTRTRTEAQLARLGRIPPGIVAPIGVRVAAPAPLPPGLHPITPWFVALGTIEPRKNLGLLLDAWDRLDPAPQLYIIGNRGWADAGLLARLDALPPDGPVRVLSGLPDGSVTTLLSGARALLFPSLAEGFGLPPLEAAALGAPVIAGELAVTRELLGDYPVYLPLGDSYSWAETIARKAAEPPGEGVQGCGVRIPRWEDHFKIVLSVA